MTLLLNAAVKQHVIHVSDRLVSLASRSSGGGAVEWDPDANKTLVVVATDAWLVISYTGLAYIDGIPTDRWIAESLAGQAGLSGGFIAWSPPPDLHVQRVVQLLRDACENAYARLDPRLRQQVLEIHIAGLQRATPRPAHLLWSVHNRSGSFVVAKENLEGFAWDRGYSLMSGGSCNGKQIEALRARLRDEGERSPEHFRDLLVECVQQTSTVSAGTVGQDCMTVVLKPGANRVEALYVPGRSGLLRAAAGGQATLPPAYSPWALLPGFIYAPALVEGHQEWQGTIGLTYVVSGPERSPGVIKYGSQTRRPPPGSARRLP